MNIFFDCEFLEDGRTIELISIALVAEDGREYFAVNSELDKGLIEQHTWLSENVMPHLPPEYLNAFPNGNTDEHPDPILSVYNSAVWKPRAVIAQDIVNFAGIGPTFWADYAAYDWVCLCQLFGAMIDLPKGWPMHVMDIQDLKAFVGYTGNLPEPFNPHDAVSDAHNVMTRWFFLNNYVKTGEGLKGRQLNVRE